MGRAALAAFLIGIVSFAALGCRQSQAGTGTRVAGGSFVIMPWEVKPGNQALLGQPRHGVDSLREDGFDTVAFARPNQVAAVRRAGLRALVGRASDVHLDLRTLSDRAIEAHMRKLVHAAGRSAAVLGYFVADEPGASDFPALAKAVAAVKRLAPGKLAYVNLLPNFATAAQLGTKSYTQYLERYVSEVKPQFIGYDNYGIPLSTRRGARGAAADYYRNLLQVRRVALRHGLPFWVAVSSKRIRPDTIAPTPASLGLQAYTALAAGARGLTWFTYYATHFGDTPIDAVGKRTPTWSYLEKVNSRVKTLARILRPLRSTGVYFTRPAPAGGLPLLPGKLVRSVKAQVPVMVGEFAGSKSRRYALVVNLSLTRASKVVVGVGAKKAGRSLRLAAGQVALLKL